MACKHEDVHLTIEIPWEYQGRVNLSPLAEVTAAIHTRKPVGIRVSVRCHHCNFTSIYNGWTGTSQKGASAWPTWLCERLLLLSKEELDLKDACVACRVPGFFLIPHVEMLGCTGPFVGANGPCMCAAGSLKMRRSHKEA